MSFSFTHTSVDTGHETNIAAAAWPHLPVQTQPAVPKTAVPAPTLSSEPAVLAGVPPGFVIIGMTSVNGSFVPLYGPPASAPQSSGGTHTAAAAFPSGASAPSSGK